MTESAKQTESLPKQRNPEGRPPIFKTPEEMQTAITDYFQVCKQGRTRAAINKRGEAVEITEEIPLTIADLAYHLGFKDRHSILDNAKRSDEFSATIARAKLYIEGDNLKKGLTGEYNSQTNNLNLASNFKYSTKADISIGIDEQLQAVLRVLPEKYAIQVQAALVKLASSSKQIEGE